MSKMRFFKKLSEKKIKVLIVTNILQLINNSLHSVGKTTFWRHFVTFLEHFVAFLKDFVTF